MSRPRVLAVVAAWLAVVVGVASLVWLVISRAGQELVSSEPPLVATTGTVAPGPTRSSAPASSTPSSAPSRSSGASPSSSPPPSAAIARRVWQGPAGLVVAACEGGAVRIVSAQPVDGFHAEVKDDGPEELEVEFGGREDESRDVRVVARCEAGVPEFVSHVED